MELLRLERETQRAKVDAENARAANEGTRAKLAKCRSAPVPSGKETSRAGATDEGQGQETTKKGSIQEGGVGMKGRGNVLRVKKPGKKSDRTSPTATAATTSSTARDTPSTGNDAPSQGVSKGTTTTTGLEVSTLLRVARAAANGNAQDLTAALQDVPLREREKASHELAVALGDLSYDWFPPFDGVDSDPVRPPDARTAQALGMMSSGEWIKARAILDAVAKDEARNAGRVPARARDPSAAYALALCDHKLEGVSTAEEHLSLLSKAEKELWPGPPEGRPPPDARAFPFGALVRAQLEEASSRSERSPSSDSSDRMDATGSDPRVRACVLAVSFLRAPSGARQAGGVDSSAWSGVAEEVVRATGGALAAALWGPEVGGGGDGSGDDGGGCGKGGEKAKDDGVSSQWQRLQSRWGIASAALDELLEMSGIDAIKSHFLGLAKASVVDRERGFDLSSRSYNLRLEGNPGTGLCVCMYT